MSLKGQKAVMRNKNNVQEHSPQACDTKLVDPQAAAGGSMGSFAY